MEWQRVHGMVPLAVTTWPPHMASEYSVTALRVLGGEGIKTTQRQGWVLQLCVGSKHGRS